MSPHAVSNPSIPIPEFVKEPGADARRAELDAVQAQLSSRASTVHFAHAGVSLLAALIFGGAAGKAFWESVRFPLLGVLAAAVSLGLATYAVVRYLRGKAALARELALFDRLGTLRRELGLDDPSALLPRE